MPAAWAQVKRLSVSLSRAAPRRLFQSLARRRAIAGIAA